jgi:RecC C-terminal domain
LPQGPFKGIYKERIRKESEKLEGNLTRLGISMEQLFALEFHERYQSPFLSDKCWRLPPLKIESPHFGEIKIIGRLSEVVPQGLIAYIEDSFIDAIKTWPVLLVFSCLSLKYQLPICPQVIFAKSGKVRLIEFSNPELLLHSYLDYFFKGKETPSPLHPKWAASLITGDWQGLSQIMESQIDNTYIYSYDSDYLKWLTHGSLLRDMPAIFETWQPVARSLFSELYLKWYAHDAL